MSAADYVIVGRKELRDVLELATLTEHRSDEEQASLLACADAWGGDGSLQREIAATWERDEDDE